MISSHLRGLMRHSSSTSAKRTCIVGYAPQTLGQSRSHLVLARLTHSQRAILQHGPNSSQFQIPGYSANLRQKPASQPWPGPVLTMRARYTPFQHIIMRPHSDIFCFSQCACHHMVGPTATYSAPCTSTWCARYPGPRGRGPQLYSQVLDKAHRAHHPASARFRSTFC